MIRAKKIGLRLKISESETRYLISCHDNKYFKMGNFVSSIFSSNHLKNYLIKDV